MTTKSGPFLPRHQNLEDRLIRAKSWLDAASRLEGENPDNAQSQTVFIYRVIAFNALYGRRQYEHRTQTCNDLEDFFDKVVDLHKDDKRAGRNILPNALQRSRAYWESVIEDEFIDNWYYSHLSLKPGFKEWYRSCRREACVKWANKEYQKVLQEIFKRIMVLRSQIFHGCATFGQESRGWHSIEKAIPVMRELVPAFYQLMSDYGERVKWPAIPYPRLGSMQHPHRPRGE